MNYSVYRFTLNMHTHRSQASVSAFYGDTAVRLLINLTDGGMPYLIGDGCTAVLSGTKADGNKLWDRCVIINNGATIQYDFTEQTSNCAGVVNCDLTVYGPGEKIVNADGEIETVPGKIVTAPKFTIVIDEREVKDDDIPISETDTALLDKIAIDETARANAESNRVSAEADRVQAETKRAEDFAAFIKKVEDAEAERVKDETDRADAEVARADAEAGRAEAETQRYNEFITLTSLVEGAEEGRAEAEQGRVTAESIRAEEFTALKVAVEGAEAKRAEAEQGRVKAEINRQQVVEELQNGFATISENGTVVTGLHLDTYPKAYKYTFQVRGCKFNKTDGAISVGAEENIGSPVTIDLPLESVVVSGRYDSTNKQVVLTLKDGSTVAFSVIDLVSGLVSSETFSYSMSLINTSLNTHSASITALENKHSQHGTRISGAEANIANHGKRISNAETKLTEQEARIEAIEGDLRTEDEIKTLIASETEGKVDKIIDTNARIGSIMVVQSDGTQTSYKIDNMAIAQSVVMRDGASNFYIDKPIYASHATNKHYVDKATAPIAENTKKIADNTKRIENLENTLLTFGEDDSVAYIKNAPGGSAPNVMLNSVGGRSKKSKNLLPYMTEGLRVIADGKDNKVSPGETKEFANGLTVRFNSDGSVHLSATKTTAITRIDFLRGGGKKAVVENGETTYIPIRGLQVYGNYVLSMGATLPDTCDVSAHKFDSSKENAFYAIGYGRDGMSLACKDIECNNLQLVCLQINANTVIDTTIYPMLNEGDTALPFEINEGITESAVTDVVCHSSNLFDYTQIADSTVITKVENGLKLSTYACLTNITPEIFLAMTGLKEGDTFRYSVKVELPNGGTDPNAGGAQFNLQTNTGNFGFPRTSYATIPSGFNITNYKPLMLLGLTSGECYLKNITITKGKEVAEYRPYSAEPIDTFTIPTEMLQRPEFADYGKEFTYIDFDRKVFVNAGHDVTLDGSADEHWNIDSAGPYIYTQVTQYGHPALDASNVHIATVCERFKDVRHSITTVIPYESVRTLVQNSSIYFRTGVASTLAQWKAYLASNPIKLRYRVATPIETDISQYLTGYDKYKMLNVGSGDIVFHNEKKNEVPSTITYVKAKE